MKPKRLWYTDAMKALLFLYRHIVFGLLILMLAASAGCVTADTEDMTESMEDMIEEEEEETAGIIVPMYSTDEKEWEEVFYPVCETEHAVAYVSAHALSKEKAEDLLTVFEDVILPRLPLPSDMEEKKLNVFITSMERRVYGYMPPRLQEEEIGPALCLNALYSNDLAYALAHEYQHLCACSAGKAGNTSLSEEMDELLSDMFSELLFPGQGTKRGILSEERTLVVRNRIDTWGEDVFSHVYELLRAGYGSEKIRSDLESR